ncbi:putative metalloprotease [Nocardioides sp. BE266]|uniref:KPN_02809 family neutral zinc metallopeptidase n=1 Tax=Nocardioides sp. BE266 TaxID=2817725 RepID=UPI00285BC77B|nr:neutral zinc metallopeptidase [Nocardioides sp. BE266]MDR7254066.1 putative metalloprotease [Nocardioides sp. BE266]
MRFNPKARLDTSRVGDGGGGSGGGGPMRIPIPGGTRAGGGIGGILIIILFVLLTQCLGGGLGGGTGSGTDTTSQGGTDTSRMGDSERYANCKTGADANTDEDCARVAVENSLYNFWSTQFSSGFKPATMMTFSGAVNTGCGQATSQVGPFYCPNDQQIYLDTTFFQDVLEGQLGGKGGDFVEPYVIGHEYGHHIQNLMGTMGKVRTQQGPESDAVRLELQADCYAGLWTNAATGTTDTDGVAIFSDLDDADIQEALDAAKTVGDDRIQQKSGQGVDPEGWTHGSSEQRMHWFMTGYQDGTIEDCDTFSASSL